MQTDLSDSSFFNHKSVMTDEIMASLEHYPLIHNNQLKGIDATLGGGGHSYHKFFGGYDELSKQAKLDYLSSFK